MMLELRPFQKKALLALKKTPAHVICVAPTGSGKSLIYEKVASEKGMRTLLVSPLAALARQQKERLMRAGVPSSLTPPTSSIGAWIINPETLLFSNRLQFLNQWRPHFLVVDECHCLWDWGERFRPAFHRLPPLIRSYSISKSLWLTATLPPIARQNLKNELPSPLIEIGKFKIPQTLELRIMRVPWIHRAQIAIQWVQSQKEKAGIIFVPTRETAVRVSRLFSALGKKNLVYHAGLGKEERQAAETLITQQIPQIIVATSAFGMGMDHSHLKWALLWQAPSSLLALAQAIGRVGRASCEGHALVLWDAEDFRLLEWTIQNSENRKMELINVFQYLNSNQCRISGLLNYFEGTTDENFRCESCDFCFPKVPLVEITERANLKERELKGFLESGFAKVGKAVIYRSSSE